MSIYSGEDKKVNNFLKVDFKILIQKVYVKTASLGSVHGLPKIFKKNRVSLKIIWILFVLISTGTCLYYVNKNFN